MLKGNARLKLKDSRDGKGPAQAHLTWGERSFAMWMFAAFIGADRAGNIGWAYIALLWQ
eukprot:gene39158-43686_t